MMKISVAILVIGLVNGCFAADNGLAQTPPMGWRSWNCFLGDISEAKIKYVYVGTFYLVKNFSDT